MTKSQLKQVIKETIQEVLNERANPIVLPKHLDSELVKIVQRGLHNTSSNFDVDESGKLEIEVDTSALAFAINGSTINTQLNVTYPYYEFNDVKKRINHGKESVDVDMIIDTKNITFDDKEQCFKLPLNKSNPIKFR